MSEYSTLWPETLRALMVHSARWTEKMLLAFSDDTGRSQFRKRMACFGMGVPDLQRAKFSQKDALTLVIEREIQPFTAKGKTNVMHLHELPWPQQTLEDLGSLPVNLRVTLSYFIEPNPGSRGWKGRYKYASHGLRFDVCTPLESEEQFTKRISKALRSEEDTPGTESDSKRWEIGPDARHRGSIHTDIWRGTAAELASKAYLAVYPAKGWWAESPKLNRQESKARYALVGVA